MKHEQDEKFRAETAELRLRGLYILVIGSLLFGTGYYVGASRATIITARDCLKFGDKYCFDKATLWSYKIFNSNEK